MRNGARFAVAVLVVALITVFAFFSYGNVGVRSYSYYNEYGEGATLTPSADANLPRVVFAYSWQHQGSPVSSVSWSYSVQISNLQGVAHWNLTMEFGYRVGTTGTITKIDSKTVTFQTTEQTVTDTGSETLDTHMGRYVTPSAGSSYTLQYFVRWKFSFLGAKSGNVYTYTNDGDGVLGNTDWSQVTSDTVDYAQDAPAEGIHAIYWSVDDADHLSDLTDRSTSTYVYGSYSGAKSGTWDTGLRVFFYASDISNMDIAVYLHPKITAPQASFQFLVTIYHPSGSPSVGMGLSTSNDQDWNATRKGVDMTQYVSQTSGGLYYFDINIRFEWSNSLLNAQCEVWVYEIYLAVNSPSGGGGSLGTPDPGQIQDPSQTDPGVEIPPYSVGGVDYEPVLLPLAVLLVLVAVFVVRRRGVGRR